MQERNCVDQNFDDFLSTLSQINFSFTISANYSMQTCSNWLTDYEERHLQGEFSFINFTGSLHPKARQKGFWETIIILKANDKSLNRFVWKQIVNMI